jgi:hypothetical protein
MPIPEIVQQKIDSLKSSLEVRYPPYYLFRISTGWAASGEAQLDTTYNSYIYSDGVGVLYTGNFAFTNISLSTPFAGGELWYHVFAEDGTDLSYSVQIGNNGQVFNQTTTVIEFWVSFGYIDAPNACFKGTPAKQVYTNDPNLNVDSVLYIDSLLTEPLVGEGATFKMYDSSQTPLGFAVTVDNGGMIRNKTVCK